MPLHSRAKFVKVRRAAALFAALITIASTATQGARPMMTDDARLVDPQACQVESWVRTNKGSREHWALPACNFTGSLELTLGGAQTQSAAGSDTTDVILQGKTLFKPLETNGYGIGLAVGYAAHPAANTDRHLLGDPYFYVPMSFSLRNDDLVIHSNLGALRSREKQQVKPTWGLGAEWRMNQQLFLIGEAFGQSDGRPSAQAGVRFWLVPNHVQIDATYGNRLESSDNRRWFSLGLRLISLPFLK
jgi:hypothetical protein